MRILHLADLHIGKKVNDFCMLKDQKYVLEQVVELIKKEKIEAVLIAGDIFDRPVPPIAALELFDNFLKELNNLEIKVFIISGNHDNMERLAYLSTLLQKSNIFISKSYVGKIDCIKLNDEINIYLMPYLYPSLVKKYYPHNEIKNYNDAIKCIIDDINLDKRKINILLAHQFVIGKSSPTISQSEQKSVGGIDEVDYSIFEKFDYVALGHLHCPQKCANENIRYSGSILKYSFSEINQKKSFCVLDVKDKKINLEFYPIKFLHEMKQYIGFIDEFLDKKFIENINCDDYIYFILKDEYVIDAKKKLSLIYPNIMQLEFDNTFTRNLNSLNFAKKAENKTIYEHFCDFYKSQMNQELSFDKDKIVKKVLSRGVK